MPSHTLPFDLHKSGEENEHSKLPSIRTRWTLEDCGIDTIVVSGKLSCQRQRLLLLKTERN